MSTVTIAVDLAKNVFEIAVAGRAGTIKERKRLSRPQFEQFWGHPRPLPGGDGGLCHFSLPTAAGKTPRDELW
jgi:hypothetical protein